MVSSFQARTLIAVARRPIVQPHQLHTPGFSVLHYLPGLAHTQSIDAMKPSNHLIPFSSCPQSFPASGSFPMSPLFASGGQSAGMSVLESGLQPIVRVDLL